jgi:MYXO-CTERM domain-containing protein
MIAEIPIVLPRPNLGPEPWPSPPAWPWIAAGLAFVLVMLLVLRRRRKRRKAKADVPPTAEPPDTLPVSTELPDRVRGALMRAFGPGWRARTTEEVAASPVLAERFGEEVAGRVVAYLRAVDRSKFSRDSAGPPEELDWWASRFAEEVISAATSTDPTSRINGK